MGSMGNDASPCGTCLCLDKEVLEYAMLLKAVAICGDEIVSSLSWSTMRPRYAFCKQKLFTYAVFRSSRIVPYGPHVALCHQLLHARLVHAVMPQVCDWYTVSSPHSQNHAQTIILHDVKLVQLLWCDGPGFSSVKQRGWVVMGRVDASDYVPVCPVP